MILGALAAYIMFSGDLQRRTHWTTRQRTPSYLATTTTASPKYCETEGDQSNF